MQTFKYHKEISRNIKLIDDFLNDQSSFTKLVKALSSLKSNNHSVIVTPKLKQLINDLEFQNEFLEDDIEVKSVAKSLRKIKDILTRDFSSKFNKNNN